MPEVPQPVPISTTALALMAAAMKRSAAPAAGLDGGAPPTSAALRRAVSSGSSSGRNPRRRPAVASALTMPAFRWVMPIPVRQPIVTRRDPGTSEARWRVNS